MQAISKDKHEKFCKLVQVIKAGQPLQHTSLNEMQTELDTIYQTYRQSLNDLKVLIMEYDAKQKDIRQKMRQLLRSEASSTSAGTAS